MTTPDHDVDVVIIGSGAGGGACAWALASQGVKVMVLEAGPMYDPFRDYHLHENNWEQRGFPDRAHFKGRYTFGSMQRLESRWEHLRSWSNNRGFMNSGRYKWGDKYSHVRGVGGTTLHFSGEAHRLHPESMHMNSRFGIAADWPFDYAELEPYYVTAEKLIGVAGPVANPVRYRSEPYPLPPHKLNYASNKVIAGTKGWLNWESNPLAVLSQPYDGRPGCNYCANCARGCPRTDKGSVDVTFMRKALASGNCVLKTDSPVVRIHPGKHDKVESVDYLDKDGNTHRVTTRMLVVACGAVETPRMLLLAANRHAPDGLANESGQVGRHFMETNFWTSSGLHPEKLGSHRGLPSDIICWDFNAPGAVADIVGGSRFATATTEVGFAGPISYAQRVVRGWGRAHKQAMREQFGRVLSINGIGESLPNDRTYIDLDPDSKDKQGMSLARIHVFTDERDLKRLSFMADTCRKILKACDITELFEEYGSYDYFAATHVFGTCRMGHDEEHSVVNADCRSHRWKNLYIVDASVFPSSGGGESPSLTIEAIAIRAAEKIRTALVSRLI